MLSISLLNEFKKLENDLKDSKIENIIGIKIMKGDISIILSAPHSVEQMRNGKIKYAEYKTACIVKYLNEKTGCFSAFKTMNFNDDANYDEKNYYKDNIIQIIKENNIKLLLDFHIMSPNRDYMIDIGTGEGKNIFYRYELVDIIKQELSSIQDIKVDNIFKAKFKNTVSASVSKICNIPCIQIEINYKLLDEKSDNNKLDYILSSFINIIHRIQEIL